MEAFKIKTKEVTSWIEFYRQLTTSYVGVVNAKTIVFLGVIKNVVFNDKVVLKGAQYFHFAFENCEFQDGFLAHDLESHGNCSFRNSTFKNFEIIKSDFLAEFSISDSRITNTLEIESSKFANEVEVDLKQISDIYLAGFKTPHFNIEIDSNCNRITSILVSANKVDANLRICGNNCEVVEITVKGVSKQAYISLEQFRAQVIDIKYFDNEGSFKISDIYATTKDSAFKITSSNLAKAGFYSIDFKSFGILNFFSSNLSECLFINSFWKYKIYSFPVVKNETVLSSNPLNKGTTSNDLVLFLFSFVHIKRAQKILTNQREVYRQLKYALGKQGDFVNEQEFHNRELLLYNTLITWRKHFWTKCIISMSFIFSNFGKSFALPLFWLIVGHLFFFYLAIENNAFSDIRAPELYKSNVMFEKAFEKYFYLINPLRTSIGSLTGYNVIIDLAMRIWSSYMLYNLIRSTRRFIK